MTPPAAKPASPLLPIGAQLAAMISIQFGATLAKALYPVVGAEGASALRLVMAALICRRSCGRGGGPLPGEIRTRFPGGTSRRFPGAPHPRSWLMARRSRS